MRWGARLRGTEQICKSCPHPSLPICLWWRSRCRDEVAEWLWQPTSASWQSTGLTQCFLEERRNQICFNTHKNPPRTDWALVEKSQEQPAWPQEDWGTMAWEVLSRGTCWGWGKRARVWWRTKRQLCLDSGVCRDPCSRGGSACPPHRLSRASGELEPGEVCYGCWPLAPACPRTPSMELFSWGDPVFKLAELSQPWAQARDLRAVWIHPCTCAARASRCLGQCRALCIAKSACYIYKH